MKVCRYDEGNTPVFTCPYHGWSYGTDGKLAGVPYFREAYHSKLDRSQWGLVEVAQLCNYKGAVFATWDPAAPPFAEYLGDFARYLDLTLDSWDGGEGGIEVLGGIQKWLIPCNWKFPAENFCGDSYHNISHRSVDLAGIGPSGSGRRDMREREMARRLQVSFYERGHQTGIYVMPQGEPTPPAYGHSPIVSEYFAHCEEQRRRRHGEWARVIGSPGELFPNTALHPRQPRTIAVWHPRGAHQTEVWRWYFVDKAAPPGGQGFPARLLHPLLGPGRDDRAGRHGELELRPCREPRGDRAAPPLQLRAGAGLRDRELPVAGAAHSRHGHGHHRGQVERAQSAQPVPPLGRVHGRRQLGRARHLAPGRSERRAGRRMSELVNTRLLTPGMQIVLVDGAVAEVVSNPLDGVWVFARYLSSPTDPSVVGSEEMIFAQDIVEAREP